MDKLIDPRDPMGEAILEDIPRDSHTLIKMLDAMVTHRCISSGETLENAHRRAGGREVIDFLLNWRDITEEADETDKSILQGHLQKKSLSAPRPDVSGPSAGPVDPKSDGAE